MDDLLRRGCPRTFVTEATALIVQEFDGLLASPGGVWACQGTLLPAGTGASGVSGTTIIGIRDHNPQIR